MLRMESKDVKEEYVWMFVCVCGGGGGMNQDVLGLVRSKDFEAGC